MSASSGQRLASAVRYIAGLAAAALTGCGIDAADTFDVTPEDCTIEGRKAFISSIMNEYYLWYDRIPAIDYDAVATPEELLYSMLYKERDAWSGMQRIEQRDRFFGQGRFDGFGYTLNLTADGSIRIAWVHTESAAGRAGLDRGARLVAVNGVDANELLQQGRLFNELAQPEVAHTFELPDGTQQLYDLAQGEVVITSIKGTRVLESLAGPVGYFMFTSFVEPAEAELLVTFETFKQWERENGRSIDTLVVDLRYNGGGLLKTAALLGSLIEKSAAGRPLIIETYNDRHPELNRERLMGEVPQAISASRVVFLTGPGTASASEQVINGLRPYTDVETVGQRTLGKPVGADMWPHCGYAIAPITFHSLNADGEGEYFEGIEPACSAHDDLLHGFGDPDEAMMNAALALVEGRSCEPTASVPSDEALPKSLPPRLLPDGRIPGFHGWY